MPLGTVERGLQTRPVLAPNHPGRSVAGHGDSGWWRRAKVPDSLAWPRVHTRTTGRACALKILVSAVQSRPSPPIIFSSSQTPHARKTTDWPRC